MNWLRIGKGLPSVRRVRAGAGGDFADLVKFTGGSAISLCEFSVGKKALDKMKYREKWDIFVGINHVGGKFTADLKN